jgi:DNA-binding PucR family transcriptional regulator
MVRNHRRPVPGTWSALTGLAPGITVAVPPADSTARITAAVVAEPGFAASLVTGAVVLGIGFRAPAETARLLAMAGRVGCSAVVVRDPDRDEDIAALAEAATDAGVGLLVLDPAIPWDTLLPVVTDVAGRHDEAADADDEVPLGDLFTLADAIADRVGGPVTLEDAGFRVLAYSQFVGVMDPGRATAILGRRMPQVWADHLECTGVLARLRDTDDVVDVADGPDNANRRLIVAVRDGASRPLGFIWVAEAAGPLPDTAAETLRRTAPIAVPHYRRHRELISAQHRHRQQLVRALLQGQGPQQRYADELDLPRHEPLVVLAVTADTDADLTARAWERIVDHVALSCETRRWTAVMTRIGRTVLAIAHPPRGLQPDAVDRLGHDIVDHSVAATGQQLHAAASTPVVGAIGLPGRRTEAEHALSLCRTQYERRFVRYDEVRAHAVLDAVTELLRGRADLRLPGLERLRAEDARRTGGARLVPTLRTYLETGGAVPATAQGLGLHPTTVRYRLTRIIALSGLDLDDPTTRMACALLLRTFDPDGPEP